MNWLSILSFMKKVWIWLKNHWYVPVVVLYTSVVWIFARGNVNAIKEVLEAKKKSYEEQIRALNKSHETELRKRDEIIRDYHETVARVEEEFEKRGEALDAKKKEKIKEIVIKSKSDHDKIRKEIENIFGFKYVE